MIPNGIWNYSRYLPQIRVNNRLTLNEGGTPLLNFEGIQFKAEYENPTGSFKDRSMAYQVSHVRQSNCREAVLSSSGNGAISAAAYCRKAGIILTIFVPPEINKSKLAKLEAQKVKIRISKTPNRDSFRYSQKNGAYDLRQSKDDRALFGYKTLAYEILRDIKDGPDAVFIPLSSGTGMTGIALGFKEMKKLPAFHIVQTTKIHPLAGFFDKDYQPSKTSLSDAIIAKYIPRGDGVLRIVKESGGSGWVISDQEMSEGRTWLGKNKIDCSYEGAAALSAFWKARKKGFKYKNPVCILTGKFYQL